MNSRFDQLFKLLDSRQWRLFLIQFVIIFTLTERFLIGMGLPHSVIYVIDIINVFLFVDVIRNPRIKEYKIFIVLYCALVLMGGVVAVFNYGQWGGSPLFSIVEIRNIVRFPIYFLACALYLDKNTIERIFKLLTILFYINFVIILFQYFTFHPPGIWTRGDYLNGLFWTSVGGNTFVNVLNILVVSYWMTKWRRKKCKLWEFIIPLCLSLVVAALIELKFFFVEIAVLYGWYVITQRKNKREFLKSVVIAFFIILLSYLLLQIMFQEYPWFRETMTLSGMFNLATDSAGYTGNNDLNRLTALFTISNSFFKQDLLKILFGIGLGNGSTYSLGNVFTDFFSTYGSSHYSWFSYSYIFVQCGLIGLILYVYSFIRLLIKRKNLNYGMLSQLSILTALLLLIYNETLKTDAGYLIYFAIACGCIKINQKNEKNEIKHDFNSGGKKMNTCILSMQDVQNTGSLLQSYSLKKIIESFDHSVHFIPIEYREKDNQLLNTTNSFFEEYESAGKESKLKKIDKHFFNRILLKIKIKEQERIYDSFRKEELNISYDKNLSKKYDYCVIGSDEVFNCCDTSPWGFTTQLFGDVKEAKNVFTYAASCGATTVNQIPPLVQQKINNAFKSLKGISVRDYNTYQFVKSISGREPEINLDPVLIGDFENEMRAAKPIINLPKNYCIVYSYYNRINKDKEIASILQFCQKHDLSIISVGMPQFWIKDYITTTPFQCLNLFKNASFVITDTFHGTIFSSKYCKRFATVVRKSNQNKLQDLINRIHISNHKIKEITLEELERVYICNHDKQEFEEFINNEREHTLEYLKRNLGDIY